MSEPEGVKMSLTCGPGMCDMDTASTKDGPRIFAGGAEGLLKAYAPKDLEDAVNELNLDTNDTGDDGFSVTAVATSPFGEELAVGLKNGDVKLYELPSLEFKTMLTRFTAPVLGLDYGMKDGGVIAACSVEPGIKLVRRSDSSKILVLSDFNGGTKSVKWDPQGEFLAAAGFDGTVKVWKVDPSLDDLATDVVHTESYFVKEAAGLGFEHLGKVSWHPEGKSLGVTEGADPLMLARDSWERSIIVPENAEEEGHVKEITVTAYSPDGGLLATAALDGRVVLWNTEEKRAVHTFVNTEQENWRHLKWLDGSTVAALSIGGSVCTLKHAPAAIKKASSSKSQSSAEDAAGEEAEAGSDKDGGSSGEGKKRGSSKHLFDEEAAEDNDGNISEADTAEIEDGAGDVAAGDVTAGLDDSISGGNGGGGEDGGRYDNGEAGGGDGAGAGDDENMLDITGPMEPSAMVPQVETTPLQDPFQPSSTPLGDARRYLCWNRVGTIISVDENTHNAVEIEFADKSAGRNQRFMDTWNFVMGALSSSGAVFASVAQEEDESALEPSPSGGRSVLYYKGLGRHSAGEDWTRMMPAGENVLAVSVGRGWAAAATDRQLVRLFTASGLQGETVMLPGPVVTMAGGGDVLMVVFHKGEPLGESQNLGYQLLDVGGKRELSKGAVCLSPASELTWLGVSEEGMVVTMDSTGLVSALTRSFGWQWTPLLDTLKVSKNKRDRFWPVGVVTGKLLAATLKGGEEHPAAYPRPVLTAVPLTALCAQSQDGEEMARFEKSFPAMEARARQRKFNLDRGLGMGDDAADAEEMEGELMAQQATLDTMVVKRIQEACAAEKAERAMDLASLLHLEKSYSIAIKVANHHGLTSLAAGMEDAMVAKFEGPEDEGDSDDERVEVLEDRGWMRGGTSAASGGARTGGDDEVQSLGPLDRARLQQARRKKSEESVSPPPRPAFSSSSATAAGDRYDGNDDDSDGDGYASETPAGVGDDADGAEIADSDDGGGNAATVSPKAKSGGGGSGKRRMEEDGAAAGDESEEEEEEEEEMEAPPAPRNPFARGGKTFASPPRKKRKDVLETMNDLRSSPSPVSTKRPPLSRLSSFAAEARHKNRNDRNVL